MVEFDIIDNVLSEFMKLAKREPQLTCELIYSRCIVGGPIGIGIKWRWHISSVLLCFC